MKVVIPVTIVVVILSFVYGLGMFGVLPTQKWADKSPAAARILVAIKLAHAPTAKKVQIAAAPPALPATQSDPPPAAPAANTTDAQLASEKTDLNAEKQQIDQEKHLLDQKLHGLGTSASASSSSTQPGAPAIPADSLHPVPIAPKLVDIYNTMSSDDLARMFLKQPDSAVVSALLQMDDRQSGKVLAAMPAERVVRVTALMSQYSADTQAQASTAPTPTASPG